MNIHELSDLDADALTITTRGPYTWVTCTADGEEVTVGPVPTQKLTTALPSHSDDMDGGVTCALIEKETEDRGGPLDETVDFWRARWKEAADRADARDLAARQWKEATRRAFRDQAGLRHELDLADRRAEKAEKERDEAQDWVERTEASMGDVVSRAEKAEKKRDRAEDMRSRWKATANSADDVIRAVLRELGAGPDTDPVLKAKAVCEARDAWRKVAKRKGDAESRPLTPEDITDEMVERAQREYPLSPRTVRDMLTAALTEPTQRPKGAEGLDGHVDASLRGVGLNPLSADELRTVADNLASEGVRATVADPESLADDLTAHADTMLPTTDQARADWLIGRGWRKADQ